MLVAGGVLAWLGSSRSWPRWCRRRSWRSQLSKLGYLPDSSGAYGWDPATHSFGELNRAIYYAYVRQIGAGAVAAGGFMTLLKTLPTIIAASRGASPR